MDEDKKKARQARFGTSNSKLDQPLTKEKAMKGEKPATTNGAAASTGLSAEEEQKRKERLERFGAGAMTEDQKKAARADRFK